MVIPLFFLLRPFWSRYYEFWILCSFAYSDLEIVAIISTGLAKLATLDDIQYEILLYSF